jgi:two-component system OmpR family sensor kinase
VSLRARLLITTVCVAALGLLAADVATYRFLSSFLIHRVDEQLSSAPAIAARALSTDADLPGSSSAASDLLPPGTYVALRSLSGETIVAKVFRYGASQLARPALPSTLPLGSATGSSRTFTVGSVGGEGPRYRTRVTRVVVNGPAPTEAVLVVAIPLTDVHDTLGRLVAIEAIVTLVVLAALAALSLWLVRIGLSPLVGMEETAGKIAAGDLSRRVEPADERTEVGRLGLALNAMLTQIESAFEQRHASESRLRRFVGDASHELRTPLTSIRGYAELFRRGADARPEDLAKSMERIEAEASRMGLLVDDLLLLARLDQGRPLERELVDVGSVVAEAVDGARAIEPERPIELERSGDVSIVGDAGRLRQVVDNLLDNVRVHTPAGTRAVVRVSRDGADVVLVVADEGPGLPTEAPERVFERFHRGDPSRSRSSGGVGLGLAIVSAIVEALGGRVRVARDQPTGATFEIRLPAASATALPPPPAP